jgi:GxxExxY protein
MAMKLLFEEETYRILGACFEVYKEMGCGFLEAVYQECLTLEFGFQGIPFRPKSEPHLAYKNHALTQVYIPDFHCFDKVIVEIKAVSQLAKEHEAQLHNYLKATGIRFGLLVNFRHYPLIEHKRIVR